MTNEPAPVEAARSDRLAGQPAQAAPGRRDRPGRLDLVVAGYDGSDEAVMAVRWAAEMVHWSSGSLRVVWAWRMRDVWDEALAGYDTIEIPSLDELETIARRGLTEIFDDLVAGIVASRKRRAP